MGFNLVECNADRSGDAVRLQLANFQVDISTKAICSRGKMSENFHVPTCQRR
jgi:hypothetical protein